MKNAALKIIGTVLIIAWGIMMLYSTAFAVIYELVAVLGIAAILFDKKEFKKHRVLTIIVAALLSGAVVLANYGLYGSIFHNKLLIIAAALVAFLGGFAAFASITKWVIERTVSGGILKKVSHKVPAGVIFWVAFAVIAVIDLLVLFLAYYPGIISPDSVNQIAQTYTGVYSNHHPVVHTMIIKACLAAGSAIFGSVNAGVATYSVLQILILSACFSYILMTLYQMQLSFKIIIPFFICFALLPYNIFYSFTMWKDVLFAAAMAGYVTALLRMMRGIGRSNAINMAVLAVSSAGVCLLRSNGWMAFLVTLIISVFVLGKKFIKAIILMAVILAASFAIRGPLYRALDISQPDILESLAIPMQQIARVLSEGEEITEEQRNQISRVADPDMIAEKYRWDTVDTFKDDIRRTGDVGYLEEHKGEFLKLYISMAREHPVSFVFAWVDQTKGFWNGGYEYWNWYIINENDFGIERTTESPALAEASVTYTEAFNALFPLQPFVSIGLMTWMIFILTAAAAAARRREVLLGIPVLVIVITLMIATPISCEFRYAYSLFTTFPLILCGVLQKKSVK